MKFTHNEDKFIIEMNFEEVNTLLCRVLPTAEATNIREFKQNVKKSFVLHT